MRGATQVEGIALVAGACPGVVWQQLGDTGVGAAWFFGKINGVAVDDGRGD